MSIFRELQPLVNISYDSMEAYLYVPEPQNGVPPYTVEQLEDFLKQNGVIMGIMHKSLEEMVEKKIYGHEVLVAKGKVKKEGKDGYFEYAFQQELDGSPKVNPNGTVDYWNLNLIELVDEGQVVAVYHPAVQGEDGFDVRGTEKRATLAREQRPLSGKGFARSEDNLVYTAAVSGKIELKGTRLTISPIYEIYGDVGVKSGNVDFNGDVVIHGNVISGMSVKASGTVTVDGIVESATIEADGDIVLRNGVKGGGKALIASQSNIHARYLEYSKVVAGENIDSEAIIDCQVQCGDTITLKGKYARILGGTVRATKQIICNEIGSDADLHTQVYVGWEKKTLEAQRQLETEIKELEEKLRRTQQCEEKFSTAMLNGHKIDPQQKVKLLRAKIQLEADVRTKSEELRELNQVVNKSKGANVRVYKRIYGGSQVGINDIWMNVKNMLESVEFSRRLERVVAERIGEND
ncbi:MAG: DUF342 domain-containing protein [Lachnospiraceae bacterium]